MSAVTDAQGVATNTNLNYMTNNITMSKSSYKKYNVPRLFQEEYPDITMDIMLGT